MDSPADHNPAIAHSRDLIRLRLLARELTRFPKIEARQVQGGARQSRFRGRGMDFDEVRIYQPGDDIRAIDWRVTARTGTTHTKLFREEKERPVQVITDQRNSMFFGSKRLKSVVACEVASLLAWAGLNANDRVGGWVTGSQQQQEVKARRSHHAVLSYIQLLAEYSEKLLRYQPDQFRLADIIEEARRTTLPGTSLFLISDFHDLDDACSKQLFELRRHADITLCQISDPLEQHLPPGGLYGVSDGEQRAILNTADKQLARHYQQQREALATRLRQVSGQLASALVRVSTDAEIAPLFYRLYGKSSRAH